MKHLPRLSAIWPVAVAAVLAGCTGAAQQTQPFSQSREDAAASSRAEFAYIVYDISNLVKAFVIQRNGSLKWLSSTATESRPAAVVIDPTGKFLYVPNDQSSNVSGYSINARNGALTPLASSPFSTGMYPAGAAIDSTGSFLYIASIQGIYAYTIDVDSGTLRKVRGSPFGRGSSYVAVAANPTSSFVYAVTPQTSSSSGGFVSVFAIDRTNGALTIVGQPNPTQGSRPENVAVDSTGAYVYVTNSDTKSIVSYLVDQTLGGELLITQVAETGKEPQGIAVDPSGQFVYVGNYASKNISAYTILAHGYLGNVSGSPFPAYAKWPWAMAVDPAAKFAYVLHSGSLSGEVTGYTIDPTSGALTGIPGRPFASGKVPVAIAICQVLAASSGCAPPPL
jgi:6-phosphogluconolactonase